MCCGAGLLRAVECVVLRAGDRVRTGDVQLGRLTLYQLSYSRVVVSFELFSREGEVGKEEEERRRGGGCWI